MDCFNNTCLSCDRECEGHYCSQTCKLVDGERGAATGLHSPPSPTTTKPTSSSSSTSTSSQSWQPTQQSPTDLYSTHRRPQSSYFMWNPSMDSDHHHHPQHHHQHSASTNSPDHRVLTPSSSRCSLSSTTSSSGSASSHTISAQDTHMLQDYFNSLDKARAAKRRSSTR